MASNRQRTAMSKVDMAWLGMDSPTNLMIINGLMLFDDRVDFACLQAMCERRLVERHPRFRQRIVASSLGTGWLAWETDPYFDMRAHVRRIALPAPGDTATLQQLLGELASSDLDRNHPLWRFDLIENYGQGCAVFARIHHCIADGVALMQVLLSLTDAETEAALPLPAVDQQGRQHTAPRLMQAIQVASLARETATQITGIALQELARAVDNPAQALERAKTAGLLSVTSAAILAKLLLIPPDRPSVLKGELGIFKRVVWSEPVDLEELKAIGQRFAATVNDVLVAVVTGALRRYLQARGDPVDEGVLRVLVPVNLRPLDGPVQLGNQFSLVYLSLPVSLDDSQERLCTVKERMTILKNSPEPFLTFQVLNVLGLLPGELSKRAVEMFASKATAILTNVPGPRQVLYLAGKPLRRILFWVPQSGQIGLGISIISYAGHVTLGFMVDEKLVPDAEGLIECFHVEFTELSGIGM